MAKAAGKPLYGLLVRDLMTRNLVVLRHDDPIVIVINKMAVKVSATSRPLRAVVRPTS